MYSHEGNDKDDKLHEYGCSSSSSIHAVEERSEDPVRLVCKWNSLQSVDCTCNVEEIQNEERDESCPER